jgi:LemA protein
MNAKALILLFVIGLLGFLGVGIYNNLVTEEENVNQAWAQVENQYQRRADLIPNLVNTVQGAADFEQETITEVIEARSRATSVNVEAGDLSNESMIRNFEQAQNQLGGALSRLLVTVERYPQLTATQNFQDLQNQLEGTENRITTERMRFNRAAQQYNTTIRRFPTSIFAGLFGFDRKYYFEAAEGAETAPEVSFD